MSALRACVRPSGSGPPHCPGPSAPHPSRPRHSPPLRGRHMPVTRIVTVHKRSACPGNNAIYHTARDASLYKSTRTATYNIYRFLCPQYSIRCAKQNIVHSLDIDPPQCFIECRLILFYDIIYSYLCIHSGYRLCTHIIRPQCSMLRAAMKTVSRL